MGSSSDTTSLKNYEGSFFALTKAGFIIPMVTGTSSAFCSLLILYLIGKSSQKLSTTYHRIMAFMSLFDFIASACMALSTLPMPRDSFIPFQGPMIGDYESCQAQGYFLLLGMVGGGGLYSSLSWYFVLSITFKVSLDKIQRRVEPVFYMYTVFMALFFPSYYLSKDLIHSDFFEPFCVIAPEYESCYYTTDQTLNCTVDPDDYSDYLKSLDVATLLVVINVASIIVSMLLILLSVHRRTRDLKESIKRHINPRNRDDVILEDDDNITNGNITSQARYSRVVLIQALLYIFSYLITWTFMITSMIDISIEYSILSVLDALKVTLFPMQGVWNLIIFVYDKAYSIQIADPSKGWSRAVMEVFLSSVSTSDVTLTNISLLTANRELSRTVDPPLVSVSDAKSVDDCALYQIGSDYDGLSHSSPSFHHSNTLSSEGVSITYVYTPESDLNNVREKFRPVVSSSECSSDE